MPETSFSSTGENAFFLGIDGGGTRTRAVLLLGTGNVIGLGEADSSNFNNMGEDVAAENLRLATRAAFADAGVAFSPVQAAFLGLAAVRSGADMARMTAAAESRGIAPVGGIQVKNDLHNALAGGLDGEAGLALISGTGSSCLGRDPKGNYFNCGGWAWFMDDGGSGFGLSHDALMTAVRMVDGREKPTPLLPAVLEFYQVPHPDFLLERLYNRKWTPAEIASFAPTIMKLAADGDPAAMGVLRRCVERPPPCLIKKPHPLHRSPPVSKKINHEPPQIPRSPCPELRQVSKHRRASRACRLELERVGIDLLRNSCENGLWQSSCGRRVLSGGSCRGGARKAGGRAPADPCDRHSGGVQAGSGG